MEVAEMLKFRIFAVKGSNVSGVPMRLLDANNVCAMCNLTEFQNLLLAICLRVEVAVKRAAAFQDATRSRPMGAASARGEGEPGPAGDPY